MKFTRRRSDRPESARNRQGLTLEALERRELLSRDTYAIFSAYAPSDLPIKNIQSGRPIAYSAQNALLRNPTVTNPLLNNEGKVVSGQDRQGNEWTITVHGPGNVIVTDTTPNDGVLDDSIDTIQLIGTSINSTFVTGTVLGSNQVATDSSVAFNRLIATSGVNSIQLNGFNLAETVAPATGQPNNQNTGIYLSGGVRTLSFANIDAPIDQATADYPINIVIGNPASPLHVQPSIHINSIFNTVFNSTATTIPTAPQTNPTVSIVVNGQIKSLDFISTGQGDVPAALTYTYPTVGTTGRTSVQATGIGRISVNGSATNFTASRTPQPFQNGFSGLSHLDSASFKGKTDAVGLDVNGPIRSLTYRRGIGNPSGTFVATNAAGQALPATQYGQTTVNAGYPASGLLGGQVTATSIGKLVVGPATYTNLTPSNRSTGSAPKPTSRILAMRSPRRPSSPPAISARRESSATWSTARSSRASTTRLTRPASRELARPARSAGSTFGDRSSTASFRRVTAPASSSSMARRPTRPATARSTATSPAPPTSPGVSLRYATRGPDSSPGTSEAATSRPPRSRRQ